MRLAGLFSACSGKLSAPQLKEKHFEIHFCATGDATEKLSPSPAAPERMGNCFIRKVNDL